jgi:hypothetical protein
MPKRATWKDNFVKADDNTPPEPQKRPGLCDNCKGGSFSLGLGKGTLKGHLMRLCKTCGEILNTDTMKIVRSGKDGANEIEKL